MTTPFVTHTYHDILDVMLHQVGLGGNQHRPAKRVQVGIVQLVGQAVNFVGRVHVDVSGGTRRRRSACGLQSPKLSLGGFGSEH